MARYERSYSGEHRTEKVTVQLTPTERRELNEAAKEQGTRPSTYAREMLFRRAAAVVAATRRNPEAAAIMRALNTATAALNAAGNNLNQIAHYAHTIGELRDRDELRDALARYREGAELHKEAVLRVLAL